MENISTSVRKDSGYSVVRIGEVRISVLNSMVELILRVDYILKTVSEIIFISQQILIDINIAATPI